VSVQLVERPSSEPETPEPRRVLCETYMANAAEGARVLSAKTGMTALVPIAPAEWAD
jgi:hypothetical protein